jgi:flagellar basal body rod protein FlgB
MAMSSYSPANAVLNPLVGNAPASIPTNNAMDLFATWVDAFEKKDFPIQSMIKRAKKPFNQQSIKVGQSYNPFITTAIKATTANNSTSVDVDDTTYIQEGDVIEIIGYYDDNVTLNYATREVAVVDSVTDADTLVLYRDSDRTSTGSWPVHAIDAYVRVISSAVAYNQTFRQASTFRGDFIYNVTSRLDKALSGDIAGIATPDYESKDHFEREIKNKTQNLKSELDQALHSGWRMIGDAVTGAGNAKPHEMGGIWWWLHQGASANQVDLGTTQLSIYDLRDILRTIWKNHRKGPATTLLMGPDTFEIIAMLLNGAKLGGLNDTSVTFDVTSINNGYLGNLKPKPIFGFPEGSIAVIDPDDWEYGPYENCDWQVVRRTPENTNKPTKEWAMWGQFSLVCTDLQRQGLIKGIDTRLNNYLGRSSFAL